MHELLTVAEMRRADAAAIAGGVPSLDLMERAGAAVARETLRRFPQAQRLAVLAGPGNNGGDGFVAARHLAAAGREVEVVRFFASGAPAGDARAAAAAWHGRVVDPATWTPAACDIVIDALFGAGLTRPIGGVEGDALARAAAAGRPIVAVDVPSGLEGDTGAPLGPVTPAVLTVTFARAKPGHVLLPGRALCGEVVVADIGIPEAVIADLRAATARNLPAAWRTALPEPRLDGHKYQRGHVLVVSGPEFATGAARLAARGAARAGAGLVTIAGERAALRVHAAHLTATMLAEVKGAAGLGRLLDGKRFDAVVLGPAAGVDATTHAMAIETLERHRPLVLDADGIEVFRGEVAGLATLIGGSHTTTVLTPHDGEFARLFAQHADVRAAPSRLARARMAATVLGAIVVSKGADTVVAAPDGRATIAANAPPFLATAGAGDVLAGMIGGLIAQGMPAFEASSAAVWMHGEAAAAFGRGLTADDLPEMLPRVFAGLAV